jgi:hypothetical protein
MLDMDHAPLAQSGGAAAAGPFDPAKMIGAGTNPNETSRNVKLELASHSLKPSAHLFSSHQDQLHLAPPRARAQNTGVRTLTRCVVLSDVL